MTREEAKEILTHNWTRVDNPNYSESELDEAFFMAIEALSADAKGDLIRRSDIQYHTQLEPMGNGQYSDVEVAYKDDIDALPSADAEWIPCSERLPDAEYGEGDSVLCCTESGLMYILYWHGGNWCVPTGEPHHWVNHKTGWHDKVIAWMPLPKPYREDGER